MSPHIKIDECPTCGSRAIKWKHGALRLTHAGRTRVVPNLGRYECSACGEVLFDYQAMKRIEESRPRKPRRKSALA